MKIPVSILRSVLGRHVLLQSSLAGLDRIWSEKLAVVHELLQLMLLVLALFVDLLDGIDAQPRVLLPGTLSHAGSNAFLFLNGKDLELWILNHCLGHSLGAIVVVFGILKWWRRHLWL